MAVEVAGGILKFCGTADHTGRPSSGLCLRRKGNELDDSSSLYSTLPEPIKTMVSRTHILSRFLTPEEIDFAQSSNCGNGQKRSDGVTRKYYPLRIRCEDFSEEVYCLLYSLAEVFQSTPCDALTVFIGEFDQAANEECGLKIVRSNSLEGAISKNECSRRKCQILTLTDKVFQGAMEDAKPHGMGCVTFLSGYQFIGNHNRGIMGFGFYGRVGISSVVSLWSTGNRDVFSIEEYGRGNVFIGGYARGKRQGAGVLILSNGSICFGEWTNGVLCGLGNSFGYTGHVYAGEVNRAFQGYGEMYYRNYSYYKGEWDGNQYSGKGVLYVQTPDTAERSFFSDKWVHGSITNDDNNGDQNDRTRSSSSDMSNTALYPLSGRLMEDRMLHSGDGERIEELPIG